MQFLTSILLSIVMKTWIYEPGKVLNVLKVRLGSANINNTNSKDGKEIHQRMKRYKWNLLNDDFM